MKCGCGLQLQIARRALLVPFGELCIVVPDPAFNASAAVRVPPHVSGIVHATLVVVVTDKGLSGEGTEEFFAGLHLHLVRPARRDEDDPAVFPNWLRRRVEAIIWTLKRQLGLERHGGRYMTRGDPKSALVIPSLTQRGALGTTSSPGEGCQVTPHTLAQPVLGRSEFLPLITR